ncbi:UDP-glucoronosyl and UDP-glucosyl transferase [Ancylostoma ceylanicum]|uniref:glucuronosyltransferase n=1 Tax=Ancylostoma ceylanicum TaxID=53326 RepID=A0A0D6LCJ5_9BILA|nr:UDP-glucoronosyl and UDP-glucosyl transferase [Ancylostoma ceylanicum]
MDQGRSHATSFAPFMHRLQKDNHSVSLYFNTYKPEIDFGMKNELIDLSGVATSPFEAGSAFFAVVWRLEYSFVHQLVPFYSQSRSCKTVLEKRRNEFARLAGGNWDLVFADSLFAVCGYGIARLNRRPHVMIHSSDVEAAQSTAKAFHRNYGILPPNFMSYAYAWQDPSFFLDRLKSATDWFGSVVVTNVLSDQFMRHALSPVVRDFSFPEFLRTSTFTFTDMPELLYPPAPRTNDYFSYGSYCKQGGTLPREFEDFVSDPKSRGTIVVAFGTLVPWYAAPADKLMAFVETINNLTEYRVVWSYNGNTVKVRDHVMLSKWIPQNELLLHNKTVLFVSHGGLKSVKEAACSGTPSLFMPMFAEQMRNAWLAKNKGYAEILNKFELSHDYLEKNIRKVLSNPKYQDKGRILKEVG